jgi:site-specific DNA recombinase
MKRAVLYARVSTDDQAERGYSLPSQLEACRKYANVHGFTVVGEYQDDISGVTPIAERPGGRQVQAMVDSKAADAVIVYQVDRLSRDTIELLITARAWLRAGVELHFCDIGKVKSENDILLVIKGWVGGEEREKIRERTKRGKDEKARNGLVVSPSVTPFGYDYSEGRITPNKQQADIVRMIYTWYVHGDDDGDKLSVNGIAGRLTRMRVTTPGEIKRQTWNRKRGAGVWNTGTIYDILSNPTYCGQWQWGITRSHNGIVNTSPIQAVVTVEVPPIISPSLWQAAQEQREYNKQMSKRNTKRNYLLRGRVRCCGFSMVGTCNRGTNTYRCNGRKAKRFERDKDGCGRYIRCAVLDPIVWGHVLDVATDPKRFRELLLQAQRQELDALRPKRERLAAAQGLIAQAETEAVKFAHALVDTSGVVSDILKKQIDDVNKRHAALCAERDTLTAEIEAGALSDEQIEVMLTTFNEDVITGLQNATFEDKQKALEDLQVQVFIEGDTARVTCRIPVPDGVFALTRP